MEWFHPGHAPLTQEEFNGEVVCGAYLSIMKVVLADAWKELETACADSELELELITQERLILYTNPWRDYDAAMDLYQNQAKLRQENPDMERPDEGWAEEPEAPPMGVEEYWLRGLEAAEAEGHELDEAAIMGIIGVLMLIIPKKLGVENHSPWITRRIEVFETQLAMMVEQKIWILNHKPAQQVCAYITSRLGNRMPFRRVMLKITKQWSIAETDGLRKKLAEVLMTLFANIDTTHLQLIEKYIINEVPGLLASGPLRCEAPAVFAAMLRLISLGDQAPYVRMIYAPSEVPELQRNHMRLTAAFAQELAVRDFPSFANYAKPDVSVAMSGE